MEYEATKRNEELTHTGEPWKRYSKQKSGKDQILYKSVDMKCLTSSSHVLGTHIALACPNDLLSSPSQARGLLSGQHGGRMKPDSPLVFGI